VCKDEKKEGEEKFLRSYDEEKIQRYTKQGEGPNPIFGDVVSFSAVGVEDSLVFQVFKSNKKQVGEVKVPLDQLDLKNLLKSSGDLPKRSIVKKNSGADEKSPVTDDSLSALTSPRSQQESQSSGYHKWIDIRDAKGQTKGVLHLMIRALPASTLDDLTLNSTQFKESRNKLLLPDVTFSQDSDMNRSLKVYIGSWNVGNAEPSLDLSDWIPKEKNYDIMAFGCQECKYEPRKPFYTCPDDWEGTLKQAVGEEYYVVEKKFMWQIGLIVFARKNLDTSITHVDSNKEATGVARVMGNKGGVTINFKSRHTSICFVNSHLAAHQDKVEHRNMDVAEITTEMKSGASDLVNNWNYVFWMGDLNYRIEWGDDEDEKKARKPTQDNFNQVTEMIFQNKFEDLYAHDQLASQMRTHKVFANFKEDQPHFPPTFKVERGKELVYKDQRTPAWCDRILWKNVVGSKLMVNNFTSANKVTSSDHKPVWADFTIQSFYYKIANDFNWDSCICNFSSFSFTPLEGSDIASPRAMKPSIISYKMTCPIFKDGTVSFDSVDMAKGQSDSYSLIFTNLERIKQYFVIVEAKANDSVIGYGMICLSQIKFKSDKKFMGYPFRVLLTNGTRGQGRLEGNINFQWIAESRPKFTKLKLTI
jgi:endonuclease/exonuclease/phosphatase family metal-dependent hydrolase